jgi:hypothetical protein
VFFAKTSLGSFWHVNMFQRFPFDPSQRKGEKRLTIHDIVFDFEQTILSIILHLSSTFAFRASSCIFGWSIFLALVFWIRRGKQ